MARNDARPRRAGQSERRPSARPSPQSRRVRQRDPRSARARRRSRRRCCRRTIRASGFDNIADVLGVSPALLERYLTAAGKISALAVGSPRSVRARRPTTCAATRRRTSTSKACRSARAAACSCATRSRSTASTSSRSSCCRRTSVDPRPRVSGPARNRRRRRTRAPGAGRRRRRILASPDNATDVANAHRRAAAGARAGEGRAAGGRRHVPAEAAGAARQPAAIVPAQHARSRPITPACRTSRASRSPVRSTPTGPATRQAGGASSPAVRPRRLRNAPCADDDRRTLARRAFRRPVSRSGDRPACRLLRRRPRDGTFEPASSWRFAAILASPKFSFRVENGSARRGAGRDVPDQRSRAGVAAVVLSLEQHPRRRAARRWRARAS